MEEEVDEEYRGDNTQSLNKVNWSTDIGDDLTRKRHELGLSQSELAELLQVDISSIQRWEANQLKYCNSCSVNIIRKFLDGDFDSLAIAKISSEIDKLPFPHNTKLILRELDIMRRLLFSFPDFYTGDRELLKKIRNLGLWTATDRLKNKK